MSINFLLQAIRILHLGTYNDSELQMMYEYLKNLDNTILNTYLLSSSVLGKYNNDLELCIEVIDKLIKILEAREEYEKCQELLNKKLESIDIMNIKLQNYEH